MKKIIAVLAIVLFSFGFLSCTAQQRAKKYGGSATVNIPANKKLVIATWKGDNLWLMTRARKEGETPETYFFQESSSWGVFEGTITIQEK